MKLHWSPRSPFVRKVMVVLHETGLVDRVECVRSLVAFQSTNETLMQDNPLSKIPTLVLDDGRIIFDSPVICEYLDTLHDGPRLFPAEPEARLRALVRQAFGDGILDALLLLRNERGRDTAMQSQAHLDAYRAKATASLDRLEREAAALAADPLSIGHVTLGIVLSYFDFRFPDLDWRAGRPAIAAWHEEFDQRPSMQATVARDD